MRGENFSPGHFPVEAVAEASLSAASTAAAAAVGEVHCQGLLDSQTRKLRVAEEVAADARKHLAARVEELGLKSTALRWNARWKLDVIF